MPSSSVDGAVSPNFAFPEQQRLLRLAIRIFRPSWAPLALTGRILSAAGQGIRNCDVTLNDNHGKVVGVVVTNGFGQYAFRGIEPGLTYIVSVNCGRHRFAQPTGMKTVVDDFYDFDFIADPR